MKKKKETAEDKLPSAHSVDSEPMTTRSKKENSGLEENDRTWLKLGEEWKMVSL